MSVGIDEQFIQEVKDKNDIADVIASYIPLVRKGRSCTALCPFHSEKTPSFHVNEELQIYKCFGCGASGDVIKFVEEMEGHNFIDALRLLSDRCGLQWPESNFSAADEAKKKFKDELKRLHVEAARIYFFNLRDRTKGEAALNYLIKRGVSKELARSFGIGYSSFDNDLVEKLGGTLSKKALIESGLVVEKEDGSLRDRFKNRIMFPIFDEKGKVIAFGGRAMADGYGPKYLNSPETPIFAKKDGLYAFHLAKNHIRKQGAILAEGYMDVISLFQYGFTNAVASLGTAMTKEQALLLKRFDMPVTIAYDADEAGIMAAERALNILEKEGISTRVIQLKDAKDPDEYLKKMGTKSFESVLRNAMSSLKFRLFLIRRNLDLKNDHDRQQYIHDSAALLRNFQERSGGGFSQIEESVVEIAQETGISIRAMGQEVYGKFFSPSQFKAYLQEPEVKKNPGSSHALSVEDSWRERESALLSYLQEHPVWIKSVQEEDFLLEEHQNQFKDLEEEQKDLSGKRNKLVKSEMDRVSLGEQEIGTLIQKVRRYSTEKRIEELEEKLIASQDSELEMVRIGQEIIALRNKVK